MNVLICTLGNRDIQFTENVSTLSLVLPRSKKYYIIKSNDQENDYEKSFLRQTEKIYENYDTYKSLIISPIIQTAILEMKKRKIKIDKIILIATNQKSSENINKLKDTYVEAKILEKYILEKENILVETREIDFDIMDLQKQKKFFLELLFENKDNSLYFEVSGGVPQFREILYIYSFMFENIEDILEIKDDEESKAISIKNIIIEGYDLLRTNNSFNKVINLYNYSSALEILHSFREAHRSSILENLILIGKHKMNFVLNKENISKYHSFFEHHLKGKNVISSYFFREEYTIQKYASYIKELIDLIEIQVELENWQSFCALLFRLFDSVGIFLLYKELQEEGVDTKFLRDHLLKKEAILESELKSKISSLKTYEDALKLYLSTEKDKNLEIVVGNVFFYYFFINSKKELAKKFSEDFLKYAQEKGNERNLRSLRNSGIYGHSFKYVEKSDIEKILNKDVKKFLNELRDLIHEIIKEEIAHEYTVQNSYKLLNELILTEYNKNIRNLVK
ncbi:MAG: hypothetical protein QXR30_04740 [Candidatus Woesearchaeota archaeon]